jgi:predicted O-methyltransferase YrrM
VARVTRQAVGTARALVRRVYDTLPLPAQRRIRSVYLRRAVKRGLRLVPEDELTASYVDALDVVSPIDERPLTYLEFGVYTGTSMSCMAAAARQAAREVRLVGFDSFQGLAPEVADHDNGVWEPGWFDSPIDVTLWFLRSRDVDMSTVTLVPGWFDDTCTSDNFAQHHIERADIVMIDCDSYSATRTALGACLPVLNDTAVMYFDDWHAFDLAAQGEGERRAFEEALAEHPELTAEPFPDYGRKSAAFVVHRTR